MEKLLSSGAITQILEGHQPANPVLQIIGYKPMTPDQMAFGQVTEELRYRLMIGDGNKAHQYCIITNQDIVNDIKGGRLEKWSIIRVTNYRTVDTGDGPPESKRKLIYILNLDVVKPGHEVGCKITNDNPEPQARPVLQSNNGNPYSNISNHQHPVNPYQDTQPKPYPNNPYGSSSVETLRSPRVIKSQNEDQPTINIGELSPYIGRWFIKGRCTAKSSIREYTNAKGSGKVFSFTLADKTGEVKVTGFNTDCERCFPLVEPNRVYILGRAQVKNADKRYTTAEYEVTLNNDSLLEQVDQTQSSDIPLARFNFVSLASIGSNLPSSPVDLIGAITDVSDVSTIISKTKNKEMRKRGITIVDMSRHTMEITLWNDQAENFNGVKGDIFVTKGARIGTYGGRSASAGDCIFINPEIPDVRKVKNWYDGLLEQNFTHLTSTGGSQGGGDQWKLISEMNNMEQAKIAMSSGQTAVYGKCKVMLMAVGKNPVYKCCPTEKCGKKLVDTQNGELKCEKCQQTYTAFKYRFKTDIEIQDCSGSAWVTLWDEKAEAVLKMKPDELERLMKMENKDEYERAISRPTFEPCILTLRAAIDNYQGEERVKLHVVNMAPWDSNSYGKQLMENIRKLTSE